jgi:hypothetical protein
MHRGRAIGAFKGAITHRDPVIADVWRSCMFEFFRRKSTFDRTRLVEQILEPTGGKILRPEDWYYAESHRDTSYVWTLSKEAPSRGAYTTGVAVQAFVQVQRTKQMTAREFITGFARMKTQTADRFLKSYPEQNQGLFTRVGMETEEGPHHILYSLFWGNNNLDIAVVVVAGTTKVLWKSYAPLFDTMREFELIDMDRHRN